MCFSHSFHCHSYVDCVCIVWAKIQLILFTCKLIKLTKWSVLTYSYRLDKSQNSMQRKHNWIVFQKNVQNTNKFRAYSAHTRSYWLPFPMLYCTYYIIYSIKCEGFDRIARRANIMHTIIHQYSCAKYQWKMPDFKTKCGDCVPRSNVYLLCES